MTPAGRAEIPWATRLACLNIRVIHADHRTDTTRADACFPPDVTTAM